jgi:hypothetical protein
MSTTSTTPTPTPAPAAPATPLLDTRAKLEILAVVAFSPAESYSLTRSEQSSKRACWPSRK